MKKVMIENVNSKNKIDDFKLTGRERDILNILWQKQTPLTASEIVKASEISGDPITMNTTQATVKKLLNRGLIQIADIVYSGTVLSRRYKPILTEQEFEIGRIKQDILALQRFGISPDEFYEKYMK